MGVEMADVFLPFGITVNDTLLAVIILAATLAAAKLVYVILRKFVFHFTAMTKTQLDDNIVAGIERPVYAGIIIGGAYYALATVSALEPYFGEISLGFTIVAILWGAYVGKKLIDSILNWYASQGIGKGNGKLDDTFMPILKKILHIFVYLVAILLVLHRLGVEITPLVASLGIGGLAVALALQDTLSNLFAGTYLASDRSIKAGDYIETDAGVKGYIDNIGWRSTRIRTTQDNVTDNLIIVPNAALAKGTITNFSYPVEATNMVVHAGVSYASDLDRVEKATLDVASKIQAGSEGCVRDFAPVLRFKEFGDSNITFDVTLKVEHQRYRSPVRHEFVKSLKKRYDREGIEISYPSRTIYMRNTGKTKNS